MSNQVQFLSMTNYISFQQKALDRQELKVMDDDVEQAVAGDRVKIACAIPRKSISQVVL